MLPDKRLATLEPPARRDWDIVTLQTAAGPDYVAKKKGHISGIVEAQYRLTNRSFKDLDTYMSHKLLALLIKKTNENPGRKIVVLDIGGGILSRATREMLQHPQLRGKIICKNVDPFAQEPDPAELEKEGIEPQDLEVINAEFLKVDLDEDSADIVWSYQFLNHAPPEIIDQTIMEVARVLAPNGEAYLNENWRYTFDTAKNPWIITHRLQTLDQKAG
ncbi:class I SAM-dependent methyltransferase, partial [Candidatus Gracilibacteria bacterium]|nr:class I SAM-dependent methyltransferase [Candidatus Gracilibacteria bacterium]